MIVAQTPIANLGADVLARAERETGKARPRDIPPEKPAVTDSVPNDPVEAAEKVLNRALAKDLPADQRLSIDRDEKSSRVVFKAIDRESGETVKQFPTEEMLRSIARLREVTGLALNVDA